MYIHTYVHTYRISAQSQSRTQTHILNSPSFPFVAAFPRPPDITFPMGSNFMRPSQPSEILHLGFLHRDPFCTHTHTHMDMYTLRERETERESERERVKEREREIHLHAALRADICLHHGFRTVENIERGCQHSRSVSDNYETFT